MEAAFCPPVHEGEPTDAEHSATYFEATKMPPSLEAVPVGFDNSNLEPEALKRDHREDGDFRRTDFSLLTRHHKPEIAMLGHSSDPLVRVISLFLVQREGQEFTLDAVVGFVNDESLKADSTKTNRVEIVQALIKLKQTPAGSTRLKLFTPKQSETDRQNLRIQWHNVYKR
jgi:hypothetical protein